MNDFLLTLGGWIITGLFGVIGWVFKMIFGKLEQHERKHQLLDERINDHKLMVAQNYTTRSETKDLQQTIVEYLQRIEDKLDKKVDK